MFKPHTYCRACGLGKPEIPTLKHSTAAGPSSSDLQLIQILDLGVMPLANDFCYPLEERAGYAPLKLMWCPRCTLGQLSVVVSPEVLYRKYSYMTSRSATMCRHFEQLSKDLAKECGTDSVVEIGSNDGTLLKFFSDRGFKTVLGVDPSENLCDIALKKGINVRNEFFSESTAQDIVCDMGHPDLVIARHVFCHIDDWHSAIHNLGLICGKDTVIAIEVPYLPDTLSSAEWDQIYHEHLSYLTIESLRVALAGSMLHIHSVKHYPIHGGAIVILLRRNDCDRAPMQLPLETLYLKDLYAFRDKAVAMVSDLRCMVEDFVRSGNTVVGYGASAKATQWIRSCGFTRKHIRFVCDNTPGKQYKLMPGSDIPIVDEGALTRELPNYAVNFAWNFSDEIIAKEQIFRKKGGKWIIPVPNVRVL